MRLHLALVLVLALPATAGCLTTGGPQGPPPTTELDARCTGGAGAVFLGEVEEGGFAGPDFVHAVRAVGRDAGVVVVRGSQREGTGQVVVSDAALGNASRVDVEEALRAIGLPRQGRDFEVREAGAVVISSESFNALCRLVLDGFYDLAPSYDNPQCADGSTIGLRAATTRGVHASSAYCGAGPATFQAVHEVLGRHAARADAG